MKPENKITPAVWFYTRDGKLEQVLGYYAAIFGEQMQAGRTIPLGNTPTGYAEICEIYLFNQKYSFMATSQLHHEFNDAISFIIECEGQGEIDLYWNAIVKEGKEVQCAWCIDKYGLRWQIIPNNLSELMKLPNAYQVLM